MATYGDVWKVAEEAFNRGMRFDLDVSGARMRPGDGEPRFEWTLTWGYEKRNGLEQIEAATADEMIARIRAIGQTTDPADVGEIHPGLAASIASVTGEDNATKENRS